MIREETIFVKHDKAIKLYEKISPETFLIFNDIKYPDIYKFQNVSFGFKEGETVKIDEPVFIVNGISQYIHFLADCIGPYLFIKQYVPNLKLKILMTKTSKIYFKNNVFDDITNLLGYNTKDCYIYEETHNYSFKEVYDFDTTERRHPISNGYNFPFITVKDYFQQYASLVPDKKKIFVSRSNSQKTSRSMFNEYLLDNFFEQKGYTVLHLEKLAFLEQISYFANATEVIGISGTNLCNLIFCQPGTKVLEINTDPGGYWWGGWSRICKEFYLDYFGISINLKDQNAEEVLERLPKIKNLDF